MKLKIVNASYHRNGICGRGFWAILFDDKENGRMIASLFDTEDGEGEESTICAVYNVTELSKGNVAFANGNSWRGDVFAEELIPPLKQWKQQHGSNQIGPFALPDNR